MSSGRYLEELYQSTYEANYQALLDVIRKDPAHAAHHIRQVLKRLYVRQGNDWAGRGIVGDTSIEASVAAHESVLADLAGSDLAGSSPDEKR